VQVDPSFDRVVKQGLWAWVIAGKQTIHEINGALAYGVQLLFFSSFYLQFRIWASIRLGIGRHTYRIGQEQTHVVPFGGRKPRCMSARSI